MDSRGSIVTMKRLLSLVLLAALPVTALAKDKLARYAGIYKGETRAQDETREQSHEGSYATRHHTITLSLGEDGSATLTQSPDGTNEITSFAHWSHAGDQIKLSFDLVDKDSTSPPMTFRLERKTLTPLAYDHALWHTLPPPPLHRVKSGATPDNDL